MKELSIEEKAKRYDEALEKARIWKDKSGMPKDKQGILDDIFPELAESEDEKIRKDLIKWFEEFPDKIWRGHYKKDVLAWIEKQANHANFRNKIEVGDKVTRNRDGVLVNLSQLNRVTKVEEKQGEQKPTDEEMKELLRTEYEKGKADAIAEIQKSAWSENDETCLIEALGCIKVAVKHAKNQSELCDCGMVEDWLKSLKDRIHPQNRWKPSDEQMITLRQVISGCSYDIEPLVEIEEQLKKLREK